MGQVEQAGLPLGGVGQLLAPGDVDEHLAKANHLARLIADG